VNDVGGARAPGFCDAKALRIGQRRFVAMIAGPAPRGRDAPIARSANEWQMGTLLF
jgi:hypothetical protein